MTRIIGGEAGGRRLRTPPGDATRPTSDRVREALFSALEARLGSLHGVRFLDLYAGSGAVGLEAASRGAAAVTLVDKIGTQLDALGLQLETVDPGHPAAQETRKLVGETLPGMVEAYRRIPAHLRQEKRAGSSPDEQIVESLGKISTEIDHVTRQLATGALDDLAVRTRYLDYKYGDAEENA